MRGEEPAGRNERIIGLELEVDDDEVDSYRK